MIYDIYNALLNDEYIRDKVDGRIKFYEYPETENIKEAHIIIDPLDVPQPSDFADNKWMTNDYLYQIDVWSNDMKVTQRVSSNIQYIMWDLGFRQGSGIDEWDREYNIFRDARQYRGKKYTI